VLSWNWRGEEVMAKEDLLFILKRLLQADESLDFLIQLEEKDLITLISLIRQRVEQVRH
jgi:hypothetical protein